MPGVHPHRRRARRAARPGGAARRPRDAHPRQPATPRRHVRRARRPGAARQARRAHRGPGVVGAVLPVEGDTAVAGAYTRWNADPCDPDLANGVVDPIVALVSRIRTERPSVKNIVVVGADDIVPMARLADTTRAGNEKSYAETFRAATSTTVRSPASGCSATTRTATSTRCRGSTGASTCPTSPSGAWSRRPPRSRRRWTSTSPTTGASPPPGVRVGLRLHDRRCRRGPRRADPLAHQRRRRNRARGDVADRRDVDVGAAAGRPDRRRPRRGGRVSPTSTTSAVSPPAVSRAATTRSRRRRWRRRCRAGAAAGVLDGLPRRVERVRQPGGRRAAPTSPRRSRRRGAVFLATTGYGYGDPARSGSTSG